MAPHKILEKKNLILVPRFQNYFSLNPLGLPQISKLVQKDTLTTTTTKKKKIQPIHCPQPVQIYTNNNKIFNKSQISNIIHQKEKSFCTTQNTKFSKFGQAIAFSINAKFWHFRNEVLMSFFKSAILKPITTRKYLVSNDTMSAVSKYKKYEICQQQITNPLHVIAFLNDENINCLMTTSTYYISSFSNSQCKLQNTITAKALNGS